MFSTNRITTNGPLTSKKQDFDFKLILNIFVVRISDSFQISFTVTISNEFTNDTNTAFTYPSKSPQITHAEIKTES